MAGSATRQAGIPATVSVAMLRVPVKARQHFEKARAAAIAGHDAECEKELTAALAIDPQFSEAYVLRASREVAARRYEAAIDDVLTAQRLEPGIAWAAIVHAEACNGLRRYDEAFALLDGLRSTELATWQAKYEMTRAAIGRGDAEAALQWSKLTLEAVPRSEQGNAILLRANALQMTRRWTEAVAEFDQYLSLEESQAMRAQVVAVRERVVRLALKEKLDTVASQ